MGVESKLKISWSKFW